MGFIPNTLHMLRNFGSCYKYPLRVLNALPPSVSCRSLVAPHSKMAEHVEEIKPPRREELLANRTALVTNCDTTRDPLAANVVRALASYGANVIAHGESEKPLASLLSELPVTHSKQRHAYIVDKIDGEITVDLSSKVKQFTNKLDVLVHNTGSMHIPKSQNAANCEVGEFDEVVKQSLTTPYALFHDLSRLLAAGNNPSVVFCSTTADLEHDDKDAHGSAYYVSKFGFNSSRMLTKMLSESLAKKGIRVNAVDAGRFLSHQQESIALAGRSEFAKTSAFVWLARPDTEMNGSQLDATEWIRRDPMMFKSFY